MTFQLAGRSTARHARLADQLKDTLASLTGEKNMRGQILGMDARTGHGIVAGDDGQRYIFEREDWAQQSNPIAGTQVDFEFDGNNARNVFPVTVPATQNIASAPVNDRNKIVAALLALFIGTLGIDRFYLGRNGSGILRLILSITFIGLCVSAPWAFIDAIRYLIMSDAEFAIRYRR